VRVVPSQPKVLLLLMRRRDGTPQGLLRSAGD
jgi:hypothetical protein